MEIGHKKKPLITKRGMETWKAKPRPKTIKEKLSGVGKAAGKAIVSGAKTGGKLALEGGKVALKVGKFAWDANAKYNPYNTGPAPRRSTGKRSNKKKGHRRSTPRRRNNDPFDFEF